MQSCCPGPALALPVVSVPPSPLRPTRITWKIQEVNNLGYTVRSSEEHDGTSHPAPSRSGWADRNPPPSVSTPKGRRNENCAVV